MEISTSLFSRAGFDQNSAILGNSLPQNGRQAEYLNEFRTLLNDYNISSYNSPLNFSVAAIGEKWSHGTMLDASYQSTVL